MSQIAVEFAWGVDIQSDPTAVQWVPAGAVVREFGTSRGRQRELDRIEAGTCTLVLDNLDRRFDSEYSAGVYYGKIRPDVHVRVKIDGTHIYRGFVRAWAPSYPANTDAIVTAECVDGFYLAENLPPPLVGAYGVPVELDWTTAGGAIGSPTAPVDVAIKALRTWPSSLNDLGAAASEVVRADVEAALIDQSVLIPDTWPASGEAYRLLKSVLEILHTLAQTEEGLFLFSADGKATFRSRNQLATAPFNTSQALFGDDAGGGELAYTALTWALDDELLIERASGSRPEQDPLIVGDSASPHGVAREGLFHVTDAELRQHLEWLVNTNDTARLEVRELTFKPAGNPLLVAEALTRQIGQLVTIRRRPPGGGNMIERTCRVQRISHSGTAAGGHTLDTSWTVSYGLSKWDGSVGGETMQPLVWDDALVGDWDERVWSF